MKKKDKVRLDLSALESNWKNDPLRNILPKDHPWFEETEHKRTLFAKAKNGDVATIISVDSLYEYCNLVFDDGFECGAYKKDLTPVESSSNEEKTK